MTERSIQQLTGAAMQCLRSSDFAGAESLCQRILDLQSENAEALHLLGLISSGLGQQEKARGLIERAIEANPLSAEFRLNLGVVLESLHRREEAVAAYRLALQIQPDLAVAQVNLGITLGKLGRAGEAIVAWREAGRIRPGDADICNGLGAALYAGGEIEPALLEFARALELRPNFAEAYNNVGSALFSRGDEDLAIVAYRKAVAIKPDLADAQVNLANALGRRGRYEEALPAHEGAARARPDDAEAQISAGDAFGELGFWDAAADLYRRAVELDPKNVAAVTRFGNALMGKMDLDGAVAAYRRALELKPDSVEVLNNLGVARKEQGMIDESLDCCESALGLQPGNAAVHSNLIYLLTFHPGYDAAEQLRQERLWNERHAGPLKGLIRPHRNDRDVNRRLRIGYVSPDLFRHVVGQNLFPLISEHDHKGFEIYCYSGVARPDAFTQILRGHSDVWRDVAKCDDEALSAMIREDGIDILVDLSLHMARNRLLVFARRPAPVQVTYLGYCAGSGLDAMDYRLSDPYLDPADGDLPEYVEKTVRLPETYWCYAPAGPSPEPSAVPSESAGHITFGCLNNFAKVSPGAIDLWAEVLRAVPRSRMIMHSYAGSHLDAVRERFAAGGVSADRLEFLGKQSWAKYLETYGRIDVALDPFPYGGGITTCDALWMGVPVVSLAGQTAVGRGGRSILSNLGLSELIARRPRQYVQTAITLAQSPSRLAELRQNLRQRMLMSPVMNARRFARNVENAYGRMWREWCDGVER